MHYSRVWRIGIALGLAMIGIAIQFIAGASFDDANAEIIKVAYVDTSYSFKAAASKALKGYTLQEVDVADADIVFTGSTNAENQFSNGYTKVSIGYSPMVIIYPKSIYSNATDNFYIESLGNNSSYYKSDIARVIHAVMYSQTGDISASDLGLNSSSKKEALKLKIPDTTSYYRRDVINALIYAITDGKEVTTENADLVKERLKDILSNCATTNSVVNELQDIDCIMIIPEYLLAEVQRYNQYPVYYDDCYKVTFNMFIKSSFDQDKASEVTTAMTGYERLFNTSYVRNTFKGEHSKASSYHKIGENIKTIESQDNLEELLGNNYWK